MSTRDPFEVMADYYDYLDAAGICRTCKDHIPCGCPQHEDTQDVTNGDYLNQMSPLRKCPNCRIRGFDINTQECFVCDYDAEHDPNKEV